VLANTGFNLRCPTMRTFLVSVAKALAATVPSPRRELMVDDLPTPLLPSSRMVHVKLSSDVVPSAASAQGLTLVHFSVQRERF
jgi:hypothetical protein